MSICLGWEFFGFFFFTTTANTHISIDLPSWQLLLPNYIIDSSRHFPPSDRLFQLNQHRDNNSSDRRDYTAQAEEVGLVLFFSLKLYVRRDDDVKKKRTWNASDPLPVARPPSPSGAAARASSLATRRMAGRQLITDCVYCSNKEKKDEPLLYLDCRISRQDTFTLLRLLSKRERDRVNICTWADFAAICKQPGSSGSNVILASEFIRLDCFGIYTTRQFLLLLPQLLV